MKIISWLVGIVVVVVGLIYVTAFTGVGNALLKPIIEAKIKEQTKLNSKLDTFHLSMSDLEIFLTLSKNNTIHIKGVYSLFSKTLDINYNVQLEELKTLQPLTQTQLHDSFHTDGNVKGNLALIEIKGKSDVAKSTTNYDVVLTDFNPTSIIAKIDQADLKSLLHMVGQKEYAGAKIDLDVNFKDITPHKLDGNILLVTKEGSLNSGVLKKDFNITVPKTAFSMNLNADLKGDAVEYKYILNSNLAKISSAGNVIPEPLKVDLDYKVDVKELALLKPISGADVRGSLRLNGDVKGTKEKMLVTGKTDLASSATIFSASLKDFTPKSVKADIVGLKLQKLLYMVKQPHYADALFDMNIDIQNADMKNLKGEVRSTIRKGLVDSKYITKAYEFSSMMPKTAFSGKTFTTLDKNIVDTKLNFLSTLANFDIKKARFDLKDTSLKSDYVVKIADLNKLYFATERHLKGSLTAYGDLVKNKDLDFTAHSNIAGGKLDAKLHNDDFHADLNSLQTLDILDILIYPKIFKSTIDADVDYNLVQSKGKLKGFLSNGSFTKNQALDLVKQYAHTDMYVEKFKGDINADINKENIVAALDLRSNTSSIKTVNTKLNSKTQQINSKVDIVANKNPLSVKLKGNVKAPNVTIDASKILEKEAKKAVTKELQKHLGKDVNKLLKGLF